MLNHYLTTLKPKQLEAATHTQGPLLIIAGAGTGKTTTITVKIAHMVEKTTAIYELGKGAGISKGMAYNHIRELKTMGYITDDDGYTITDAGRIAVI